MSRAIPIAPSTTSRLEPEKRTDVLTGRQIREARDLLGITRSRLAARVGRITTLVVMRAEENEDEPLPEQHAAAILQALERLGCEIGPGGVRLREVEP